MCPSVVAARASRGRVNQSALIQLLCHRAEQKRPRRVEEEVVAGQHAQVEGGGRLLAPGGEPLAADGHVLQAAEGVDGAVQRRLLVPRVGLHGLEVGAQQREQQLHQLGVLVHLPRRSVEAHEVFDEFVQGLVSKVARYEVGDGMTRAEKPKIRMGPLHTAAQRDEIESQVNDAVDRGAKVLLGGARPEGAQYEKGNYYQPTILVDVPDDARAVQEETFGPALPIFRVGSLDEAIEKANNSMYGLGSSIWTKNLDNIETAIDRIQAGNVWVNSLHYGYDELPFGGVKASGFGREHGPEALDYYLEPKGVVITR